MSAIEDALGRAYRDVLETGYRAAVVGGFAVSARVEPRFTRDVDLAVAVVDDQAAESLIHQLQGAGYRLRTLVEHVGAGRLSTARMLPPGGEVNGVVVDLLFASSGIEPAIVDEAEALEIVAGLIVPVARAGHLVALKLLARDDRERPQDQVDLRALREALSQEEIARARRACQQIERSGYGRGRDLSKALADYLAE